MILTFPGTAGSGKTTITGAFGKYLEREHTVAYVNLDTGVKMLSYSPDLDVRDTVTVEGIMEEGFGPNGAIVESYDWLLGHVTGILEKILELNRGHEM